jgi:hypothetical protein
MNKLWWITNIILLSVLTSCDGLIDSPTEGVVENSHFNKEDISISDEVYYDPINKLRQEEVFYENYYGAQFYENGIMVYPQVVGLNGNIVPRMKDSLKPSANTKLIDVYELTDSIVVSEHDLSQERYWAFGELYDAYHVINYNINDSLWLEGLKDIDTLNIQELNGIRIQSENERNFFEISLSRVGEWDSVDNSFIYDTSHQDPEDIYKLVFATEGDYIELITTPESYMKDVFYQIRISATSSQSHSRYGLRYLINRRLVRIYYIYLKEEE